MKIVNVNLDVSLPYELEKKVTGVSTGHATFDILLTYSIGLYYTGFYIPQPLYVKLPTYSKYGHNFKQFKGPGTFFMDGELIEKDLIERGVHIEANINNSPINNVICSQMTRTPPFLTEFKAASMLINNAVNGTDAERLLAMKSPLNQQILFEGGPRGPEGEYGTLKDIVKFDRELK